MYTANKTQQSFQKNGQTGKTSFKSNPDHLVTITGYDLENKIILGTDQFGRSNAYRIEKKAYDRFEARSAGRPVSKYMGHRIDDKMAKFLPVGHRVVVEAAADTGKPYLGKSLFEGNKIHNSTAQGKNKLFHGLFSATVGTKTGEMPRIIGVQSWNQQAFSVNDKEALKAFAIQLNNNYKLFTEGKYVSYLGFQIRLLKKNGDSWTLIDSTHPYDFIPGQKDENGNEVSKSSPLSVEKFMAICKEYQEYLLETFPTFKADGLVLDIMTFTNYIGSKHSDDMVVAREFQPEAKLTSRRSKISSDDEQGYNGRNSGVMGIIELTSDTKVITEENQVIVTERNMVQKIHANGYTGEVREMVKAFDGSKVSLDNSLVFIQQGPKQEVNADVQLASKDVSDALEGLKSFMKIDPEPEVDIWGDTDPFADIPM